MNWFEILDYCPLPLPHTVELMIGIQYKTYFDIELHEFSFLAWKTMSQCACSGNEQLYYRPREQDPHSWIHVIVCQLSEG